MRDEKMNRAKTEFTQTLTKKDGRRERWSRKAWGTEGPTLFLPELKKILLKSVITECVCPGANLRRRGTHAFFLITGKCIHLSGVVAGPQRSRCSKKLLFQKEYKMKPKNCSLPNRKDDIRNTRLYTP